MSHTGERKHEQVKYFCSECPEFELEKSYTGAAGTEAEAEYEQIEPPDECPVCGGAIEKQPQEGTTQQ